MRFSAALAIVFSFFLSSVMADNGKVNEEKTPLDYLPEFVWPIVGVIFVLLVIYIFLLLIYCHWSGREFSLWPLKLGPKPDVASGFLEELPDRAALYRKISKIVSEAKKGVLDTTWGSDAPDVQGATENARTEYFAAQKQAIQKVPYRELFTFSEKRKRRIVESIRRSKREENYDCRILPILPQGIDLLDLMVVDSEHVILGHVSHVAPAPRERFVYIRSSALARFFENFYTDLWKDGKTSIDELSGD